MSHPNEYFQRNTYSERINKRFLDKDLATIPSTVRALQTVAIAGTVLTYVDSYLLTERGSGLSILIGALLCFFICRFVVRGLAARNGTARMIGFICAIFSTLGGGLGLVLSLSHPSTPTDVVLAIGYLIVGIAWFVFDYQRPTKQHLESRLKK